MGIIAAHPFDIQNGEATMTMYDSYEAYNGEEPEEDLDYDLKDDEEEEDEF